MLHLCSIKGSCHPQGYSPSWSFVSMKVFCIQGLTSRGLTRKEDRGRLLPFEQSCRPGVKTQPESHSEHAGSCQLQDEKHVYCL